MEYLPEPKFAATIVAASSFAAKFYMSAAFRGKMNGPKAETQKVLASKAFKNASAAQLNDAEYAPWLLAALLYFDATNASGTAVSLASGFAAYGEHCGSLARAAPRLELSLALHEENPSY